MKEKLITEKTGLNRKSKLNTSNTPFIHHLKKRKYVHVDEYEAYTDMAELDLGDGFNAFDEDFYNNLYY